MTTLINTGKVFGTHGAYQYEDAHGNKFLVKTQDRFRCLLDKAIADLQEYVGIYAPSGEVEEWRGQPVAIHEWIPGKEALDYHNFDPSKGFENDFDLLVLQQEWVFDWMISNHDSHPGQFIRCTQNHTLLGLDKGQAFRYFGDDRISENYHPNEMYWEKEPVYNTFLRQAKQGKLKLYDFTTGTMAEWIHKLSTFDDDWYENNLKSYPEEAKAAGFLATQSKHPNDVPAFLAAASIRRQSLAETFAGVQESIDTATKV